jgi:hypothetical protein
VTVLVRGSVEYANRLTEAGERVKANPGEYRIPRQALGDDGEPRLFDGVLWSDVWDYCYAAMSESDLRTGGALIPRGTA